MRIIAGIRRGHSIRGPSGDRSTRPTSDLVREAIFNIVGPEVDGRAVLDLFAGTGAIGLEALSRGASAVTFVEKRRENVALIRQNLAQLRFEGLGLIAATDAYRFASNYEAPSEGEPVIAFLDPPYRDYEERPTRVRAALEGLRDRLPSGSTIVVEAGRRGGEGVLPEPDAWDVRRYGSTHVAFLTLVEPAEGP